MQFRKGWTLFGGACVGGAVLAIGMTVSAAGRVESAASPAATKVAAADRPSLQKAVAKTSGSARPPTISGFMQPGESRWFDRRMEFPSPHGTVGIALEGEPFDTANHPFFTKGPTGRACVTCHQPSDAMSLSLDTIRARWDATKGADPIFHPSDGANCPNLPKGDPKSHSLLLERGLFRIGLPWPPKRPDGTIVTPEFDIEVVADPTGCNTSTEYGLKSANPTVSVYRRPRMIANVRYVEPPRNVINTKNSLPFDVDHITGERSGMSMMADARSTSLLGQAMDAASSHMGMSLPRATADRIVAFERQLYVAQQSSRIAGRFDVPGTPKALGVKTLIDSPGINGNDRNTGTFFFFDEWKSEGQTTDQTAAFKASVARGYDLFFLQPFWIRNTYGINHFQQMGNPFKQTCAFCHSVQPVGVDNVPGWMDLGLYNLPPANPALDLPVFKITCKPTAEQHPYIGRTIYTQDPGRALISGECKDVGALMMQQLRALSGRGPYFANGSAKNLREVIDFYDRRYSIGYTEQNKEDLVNFLSVL